MRRQAGAHELLDGPLEPRTLEANLRDLARVNRFLGGGALSWKALEPLLRAHEDTEPLRLLDIGTGAADIPRALLRRTYKRHLGLEVVGTDIRPEIVELAARQSSHEPALEIRLGVTDRLEELDGAFDVAHASLVLHHLEPPAATTLLREMARVSSRAVIVNDLDRGWTWWLGAWLLAHVSTGNRYTRRDGPLSVRRAYRPMEVVRMAEAVGLHEVRSHAARPPYRYALVFEHNRSADG